ncbi:sensor histidine kinase [Lacibacter sediminis]|uniref:Histidine kinase n=1 Tax=Lacibacter sediminis TaxID=2760713 RepID=A0A7G5XH34_9BACT|nr:sensor histidine kinase [Lacibacter sediminis]QNA44787.1 histidine kinase [Lacibacter sediminis]
MLYCITTAQFRSTDFTLYSIENGLSSNLLTSIVQDEQGYLWIGSANGLNRFDGNQFVQYHQGTDKQSIPDENIRLLKWFKPGTLAVATNTGLQVINTRTRQSKDIFIQTTFKEYAFKYNDVFDVATDDKKHVFILTRSGFYHFDQNDKLLFRFDNYKTEKDQSAYFIFGQLLLYYSGNELLLSTSEGVFLYNISKKQLQKLQPGADHGVPFVADMPREVASVRQTDNDGYFIFKVQSDSIIYINTNSKKGTVSTAPNKTINSEFNWRTNLFRYNDTTYFVTSRTNGFYKIILQPKTGKLTLYPEKYLADYFCAGFLKDKQGRLWITTSSGLLKQNLINNSVTSKLIPQEVLQYAPAATISFVYVAGNRLYVGCRREGGLLVFEKNTLGFIKKISFKKHGTISDDIINITHPGGDTLFIGTNGPLCWFNMKTNETGICELEKWTNTNWVSSQFKDRDGNVWITSNANRVYYYHSMLKKFYLKTMDHPYMAKLLISNIITEDTAGHIWLGGQGLCRINRLTHQPDFFVDTFPEIRFPRKAVLGLYCDGNNKLWFGNISNGLIGYSIGENTFEHYTAQNKLPSNNIYTTGINNNMLWMGSESGIAAIDLTSKQISSFDKDDGFPLQAVTSVNFYHDKQTNYLYSGFGTAIVRFSSDSLLYTTAPPQLFIESIRFNNDSSVYLPGSSFVTDYQNNDFTIRIGSVYFYKKISSFLLSYRILNSRDSSWKAITGSEINFNNLPPGKYDFEIKMSAKNERWPAQVKQFNLTVKSPFWETPWFIALMSVLIALFGYMFYRWRIYYIQKAESEKARMQELRAEKYKTQFELEQISNYFSLSLVDKKNTDDVLWDVAKNLIGRMGCEDCMIYLWNNDKTKMQQRAGYGNKNSPEKLAENLFEVEMGQGVVGYVMQTKEPVIIADTRTDKRYRVDDMKRLSEICVPIIHEGELMGIIDSENSNLNHFKERDLQIMTTIATLTGNKIKQVESEQVLAVKKKELAATNEHLAEAQLSALQAQMNPHFVFNALNSIKRMILDDEKDKASRYLSKFAQLIRLTLNHSRETFVTLRENVEYLNAYLEMEQLRFKDSFNATVKVDAAVDDEETFIPSLMIQPLVENAVWHGLLHKEGKKKITVRFSANGPYIICSIEDNGIGIRRSEANKNLQHAAYKSVGLDNLRNRIAIMNEKFDMDCSLTITDLSETDAAVTGTLAVLKFKNRDLV